MDAVGAKLWTERLAGVDDDYLIGLSNKGIVKRAYKDKGETATQVQDVAEEARVTVGDETVTVCYPLGESKCTCPSRSVCRHVVQAILVLKERCGEDASAEAPGGKAEPGEPTEGREEASSGQNQDLAGEINAYPYAKLKKTLGVRQFQAFVNQVAAGIRPVMQSASVVTVQLPGQGDVVKLLSPLEYSTCTCHKKELCVHKASAILWCQLEAGVLTKEALLGEMVETREYDLEGVRDAAAQMKAFLEELFATGLSRTSPDALDYLERLAIISHNEGLARFEGYFRALSDSYDRYFARKASFKTEELMERMTRLYRRVSLLGQAQEQAAVSRLAGEFRADYLPAGNLNLIGIAMEHFESQTGYEGETVYFLEENTKKWYTYTNARPVFYDSRKKRGYMEKAPSPWGLNISLEDMLKVRLRLTGAKCDTRNRLSSSQETKGEITGEQGLGCCDLEGWYYRDFGRLYAEQIGKRRAGWLAEQEAGEEDAPEPGAQPDEAGEQSARGGTELVFVQPWDCAKAAFSQTGQMLTLPLYDRAGREILVEVTYSKQESGTIRYLERISEKKLPCFLGKITLRDGRMRLYPVDVTEIREDSAGEGGLPGGSEEGNPPGGRAAAEDDPTGSGSETEKNLQGACRTGSGSEAEGNPAYEKPEATGHKTKYEVMEELSGEAFSLLEDLYQSGFDTVHDSTLEDIRKTAKLTEQYGMSYLSELLSGMAEEIRLSRHRMERQTGVLAELYVKVSEYLYYCRQKAAYDRGADYYSI